MVNANFSGCLILVLGLLVCLKARGQEESEFYKLTTIAASEALTDSRSPNWKPPPDDLTLEVSGIAVIDERKVAVSIRKGEVWILEGDFSQDAPQVSYSRFASALHEPLGLLFHKGDLFTAQRSELTRLRDTNQDGVADEYWTVAKGWGVTGHYHEYAYGPELDSRGNLWVTLNIGMGLKGEQLKRTVHEPSLNLRQGKWRGWGMKITPNGQLEPVCAGMRSPSGVGRNREGDVFYTDQQGNWVATNSLHHLRKGAFFHHPDALASMSQQGSTIAGIDSIPNGVPYPNALKALPQMKPPAVWFPYKKAGQSATDIVLDNSDGKFGPFAGQLFIGEFTQASMHRVFLEKVGGEYQGACFPFRSGFASAVLRAEQAADGAMFVGLTNRGWSSLGTASYGLQRLAWTGKTPFEIKEMRATPNGFRLIFTQPIDPQSAISPNSIQMKSYTYLYHSTYGSDEIQTKTLKIASAVVSEDELEVTLKIEGLRPHYVHELHVPGVKNRSGQNALHPYAFYTLNKIPTDSE